MIADIPYLAWFIGVAVVMAAIEIRRFLKKKQTKLKLNVTDELRALCEGIMNENRTEDEWAEIEADDMFRSPSFSGEFDATINAFTFSYHDESGKESWLELSLEEVLEIAEGRQTWVEVHPVG